MFTLSPRAVVVMACLSFLMLAAGCGTDAGPKLPRYEEPKLTPAQRVTVQGKNGTIISIVDNMECRTGLVMNGAGGNTVIISPGKHKLTVANGDGTIHSNWSINMHGDRTSTLEYDFVAGHRYEIGMDNKWNPMNGKMKIIDLNDGSGLRF